MGQHALENLMGEEQAAKFQARGGGILDDLLSNQGGLTYHPLNGQP